MRSGSNLATVMARKFRVEYEGAIYHLLNRGDRKEPVFCDDSDRLLFLETLGQVCAKTDWQVHAYCLMNNHFHLVVGKGVSPGQCRKRFHTVANRFEAMRLFSTMAGTDTFPVWTRGNARWTGWV